MLISKEEDGDHATMVGYAILRTQVSVKCVPVQGIKKVIDTYHLSRELEAGDLIASISWGDIGSGKGMSQPKASCTPGILVCGGEDLISLIQWPSIGISTQDYR
jgi:hypothetical protein